MRFRQILARCVITGVAGFTGLLTTSSSSSAQAFSTQWRDHQQVAGQREWSIADLSPFKHKPFHEKDPETGQSLSGKGVLLSEFVEKALQSLLPEQQAAVDLIVLRGRKGEQAFMPRLFASKYPVMVGIEEGAARLSTIVPFTSQPRVRQERLPVERYFIQDLVGIEFTTYESTFGNFFLKKRTDPRSIRGERIVVQNCMSCHQGKPSEQTPGSLAARFLADAESAASLGKAKPHPKVLGFSEPAEDERKAISSYLAARKLEITSK